MRPITGKLAILFLLTGMLVGCAAPAGSTVPSASPTAQPSESPLPTESASVAPSPTPGPSGEGVGGGLPVGFATVTADELFMREEPGLAGAPLMTAETCIDNPDPNCERPFLIGTDNGYVNLYVFDGPIAADGYNWYLAATEMHTETRSSLYPEGVGWVAAGDEATAWLVPASRSCPGEPVELADITLAALTRLESLYCFGDEPLTLTGWYPAYPPGEDESSDNMEACHAVSGWLACGSIFDMLRPEQAPWAGDNDYLSFSVEPSSGVAIPARGQWVEVTGAFDHPAAARCGDVAAVLICRSTFVVSSATVP